VLVHSVTWRCHVTRAVVVGNGCGFGQRMWMVAVNGDDVGGGDEHGRRRRRAWWWWEEE